MSSPNSDIFNDAGKPSGNGELIDAAIKGDIERVKQLLDQGADVEEKDSAGDTVLNEAARTGQAEIVQLLIERGAKLDVRNHNGRTAESWAESNRYFSIAAMLRAAAKVSETWELLGAEKVAHICTYPRQERKLTDIFDFANRERYMITENLRTRVEAMTPFMSFNDMQQTTLERAFREFTQLGGVADEMFVLRGVAFLDKKDQGPASGF